MQNLSTHFCATAFPTKRKTCSIVCEDGLIIPCRIRWHDIRDYEGYLTRGWLQFRRIKNLKKGTRLYFGVFSDNESIIYVRFLYSLLSNDFNVEVYLKKLRTITFATSK